MKPFSSGSPSGDPRNADRRSSERAAVNYETTGETRARNYVKLRVTNVSLTGFLVTGDIGLSRGERLLVGFPVVGHRDAFVVWTLGDRTGFQFDRPIGPDDMKSIVLAMAGRAADTGRR